jgi:hypothetical protein
MLTMLMAVPINVWGLLTGVVWGGGEGVCLVWGSDWLKGTN